MKVDQSPEERRKARLEKKMRKLRAANRPKEKCDVLVPYLPLNGNAKEAIETTMHWAHGKICAGRPLRHVLVTIRNTCGNHAGDVVAKEVKYNIIALQQQSMQRYVR